ncbi:MAG TPA: glycosyltransferase [Thermomicrobiales bacterium]|nr:glycosyltransferase [Thermomicrobiales bacterium]
MSISEYTGPSVFGYETDQPVCRAAIICLHTSPIERIGQRDAGGMNVYVKNLAIQLARQGIQVDIFTRRTDPLLPEVVEVTPGVNVIHITAGPPEPRPKNELFVYLPEFANEAALYSLRAQVRYDVIHAHYWLSGWAAHLLQRYWHVPHLLMFHTTAHMKNAVAATADRETPLRMEIERKLLDLADGIVAANPDERTDLISRMHTPIDKVCTVPPGVDLRIFQPGSRADARRQLGIGLDEKIVVSVGRVDPIKGFDTLLHAMQQLKAHRQPGTLILAGGDLDEAGNPAHTLAGIAAQAEMLGVRDRVRFVGSQSHEQLATFYRAADVVAVPSRYESFGLVAIEAMASGTPVVASNVGGLRFTVENDRSGYLVPHSDPTALADAMTKILTDDALRDRLGEGAVVQANRFAWESVGEQIERMYRLLISGYQDELCGAGAVTLFA